jgi:hypothetical protein
MRHEWTLIALLTSISTQANATLIFNDGNTHQINSALFEDVHVGNGSNLNITQGGSIQTPDDQPAILVTNSASSGNRSYIDSTITLSGNARLTGGIESERNDDDVVVATDDAQIVAQGEIPHIYGPSHGRGAVVGMREVTVSGNARLVGADNATNGGDGINFSTSSGAHDATVHGGEIVGGNGGESGGDGIDGGIERLQLDVSDGTIQGGAGSHQGGHGITSYGSISGSISGGVISGGSGETGGHAINSELDGGMDLTISGGRFQGGNGDTYGGNALNIFSEYGYSATISGGYFDAGTGLDDDGWLLNLRNSSFGGQGHVDITGGHFGYDNIGNGFGIFTNTTVDIHGWDLELNDNLLTGYLLDGSWIETPVSLAYYENAPLGTLNLINHENVNAPEPRRFLGTVIANQNVNVPEPGSLMLLAIGLTGVWASKRRKAFKAV